MTKVVSARKNAVLHFATLLHCRQCLRDGPSKSSFAFSEILFLQIPVLLFSVLHFQRPGHERIRGVTVLRNRLLQIDIRFTYSATARICVYAYRQHCKTNRKRHVTQHRRRLGTKASFAAISAYATWVRYLWTWTSRLVFRWRARIFRKRELSWNPLRLPQPGRGLLRGDGVLAWVCFPRVVPVRPWSGGLPSNPEWSTYFTAPVQ